MLMACFIVALCAFFALPSLVRIVKTIKHNAQYAVVSVQISDEERSATETRIAEIYAAIQANDKRGKQSYVDSYLELGGLYEKIGYLAKARDAYQNAVRDEEWHYGARVRLASVFVQMQEIRSAREILRESIEHEPSRIEGYEDLAKHFAALNETEEARGAYLEGLARTSNNKELMARYTAFLDSVGMNSEASQYRFELAK